MSIVELKCPTCGANLDPSTPGPSVVCPYCGNAFVREIVQPAGVSVAPRKMNPILKALRLAIPVVFVLFFVVGYLPYPWNYYLFEVLQYGIIALVFLTMILASFFRRR